MGLVTPHNGCPRRVPADMTPPIPGRPTWLTPQHHADIVKTIRLLGVKIEVAAEHAGVSRATVFGEASTDYARQTLAQESEEDIGCRGGRAPTNRAVRTAPLLPVATDHSLAVERAVRPQMGQMVRWASASGFSDLGSQILDDRGSNCTLWGEDEAIMKQDEKPTAIRLVSVVKPCIATRRPWMTDEAEDVHDSIPNCAALECFAHHDGINKMSLAAVQAL